MWKEANNVNKQERKVVVIGAGFVGTTYVYALMHTGLVGEIVLIDLVKPTLQAKVDLSFKDVTVALNGSVTKTDAVSV